MKYIIVIGDGMGDYPVDSLRGLTPLEYAATPNLDRLAQKGLIGCVSTVPPGMTPGSDVAIMSLMGYNPKGVLTGRGPLEALAQGVTLSEGDLAFRLNLVTMEWGNYTIIRNHAAGDIPSSEAGQIIQTLTERMPLTKGQSIHQGISYRHVFVWPEAPSGLPSIPPHDYLDKPIDFFLNNQDSKPLADLIRASWPILIDHSVNQSRRSRGLPPANSIWLWGQGRVPKVKTYLDRWGLTGATVSAVDIIRGLGLATGLAPKNVVGATGLLDTNYGGKVEAALEALETGDLVVVHLEAPDEASHQGNLDDKIAAITNLDQKIVGPIIAKLTEKNWPFKMLAACDHYTPIRLKTHSNDPVPFIIYDSTNEKDSGAAGYSENSCAATGLLVEDGPHLANLFFGQPKE
ncbi:MAG: cofactor-independent phosphoglycerate mutase [Deltaproteobacteria bacterium]|jgi:2,3-bisphosphoglycerate-independent phosphoglycerate mutase|nr:cofactor-independent phosphoglycerate mutase [Deltaproteobacteria bacterium]